MKKDARLNEKQKTILLDYFKRSVDGETMEEIAKSYDINRKTLWAWKNTDEGQQLHKEWARELTEDAIPQYFTVLKEKALSGSYKHMELLAKLMDLFPASKQEIVSKNENTNTIVEEGLSKETLAELNALLDGDKPLKRVK
ncbi:MAG: phBC6A51 family helix-turn-helix protein [Bacillota bacterium]|nr:phBC6A51 family helix-turn-helix protein [Bacillota bacterium]